MNVERERIRPTATGLFMTELLIAVGIFALCAAVCLGLFAKAETVSQDCADQDRAVEAAKSAAAVFRLYGWGDGLSELSGGNEEDGSVAIHYDGDWQPAEGDAAYSLTLTPVEGKPCPEAELRVTRDDGTELLCWRVAALEAA